MQHQISVSSEKLSPSTPKSHFHFPDLKNRSLYFTKSGRKHLNSKSPLLTIKSNNQKSKHLAMTVINKDYIQIQ